MEKAAMWVVGRAHPNNKATEIMTARTLRHVLISFLSDTSITAFFIFPPSPIIAVAKTGIIFPRDTYDSSTLKQLSMTPVEVKV
jgi:hypothetical protein